MKYVVLGMALTALCCKGLSASQPNCAADRSKLIVASDFNYPPFEYQSGGSLIGFDISVACELVKRLGYGSLEVVDIPRGQQNNALAAGSVNLVISAQSVLSSFNPATGNPAAVIYANDSASLISSQPLPPNVNSQNVLTILNNAGSSVGALENTREIAILGSYPNLDVVPYDDYSLAVQDLLDQEIDAFFVQGSVGAYTVQTNGIQTPFFTNVTVPPFQQTQGLGILVSEDCCTLYASVRQAIADMIADGTLAALGAKFSVPVVQPFANLTPPDCANIGPVILERNATANFIYNKYCPCNPIVVPVTVPAPVAAPAGAVVAKVATVAPVAAVQTAAIEAAAVKPATEIKSDVKLEATNEILLEAARKAPVVSEIEPVSDNSAKPSQAQVAKKSVKSREAEMRAAEQKRKAAYLARKAHKQESGE